MAHHRATFAATFLLAATTLGAQQSTPRSMSFDDVMAITSLGAVEIAPDGTSIVFSRGGWEDSGTGAGPNPPTTRAHLWTVPTAGGPSRQLTYGEGSEGSPRWSPDGRSLAFVAAREGSGAEGAPRPQVWLLPMSTGGEARPITRAPNGVSAYAWSPGGTMIAYVTADSVPSALAARRKEGYDAAVFESEEAFRPAHLWTVDLLTGDSREVAHGDFTLSGLAVDREPSWSPDGTRLAFNAPTSPLLRELRGGVYIADVGTGHVERIADAFRSPALGLGRPIWSPDGRTLAWVDFPQSDTLQGDGIPLPRLGNGELVLYDVATARATIVRDTTFDYVLESIAWAPDGRSLLVTTTDGVYRSLFLWDPRARTHDRLTRGVLLGPWSISDDGAVVAFAMETPTSPADLYVDDLAFRAPRKLTTLNPQVSSVKLGETEVITWQSTDDRTIEGILLKPVARREGDRVPLLVVVHGGPTGAHQNGFRATPTLPGQVWAGRGWAVLYPNPRGSTGYGERFMTANILDLGGGDYQDIMAGVDKVIDMGIADPDRLAVRGWSYGGQMTAWIVTQTERFKAASMGAGISDLVSMYGTSEISGYEGLFQGGMPTAETWPTYRAHSPLTFVDAVTTPLLILHGADDPRVPPGQALEFYRALKDRGKTVELVFYPREQHGLREYAHLVDRMERDWSWINEHTRGVGAAEVPAGGRR